METSPIVTPSGGPRAALPSPAEVPAEGDPFAAVLARQMLPADAAALPTDKAVISDDAEAVLPLDADPAQAGAGVEQTGGGAVPVPAPAADSQTLLALAAWGQAVSPQASAAADGEPADPTPDQPAVPAAPATAAAPVTEPADPATAPSGRITPPGGVAAAAAAAQSRGAPAETGPVESSAAQVPAATGSDLIAVVPTAPAHARGPTLSVAAPVASPGFADDFSRQVVWISSRGLQSAELRLDPPDLGPVRVTIQVSDDRASAVFNAQHPLTRDAIEAALPRLRDALAQAGVQLGSATVSAESFGNGHRQGGDASSAGGSRRPAEPQAALAPAAIRRGEGLIDLFA